jgi:hypothetical protein
MSALSLGVESRLRPTLWLGRRKSHMARRLDGSRCYPRSEFGAAPEATYFSTKSARALGKSAIAA